MPSGFISEQKCSFAQINCHVRDQMAYPLVCIECHMFEKQCQLHNDSNYYYFHIFINNEIPND